MVKINVTPVVRPAPAAVAPLAAPVAKPPRGRGARRYGKLNSITGRILVALVVISAIPVASNRPAWWLIWTLLIGLGSLIYLVRAHLLMGNRRNLQIGQFRVFIGLALLVPMFAVLQCLPLADLLPLSLQSLPTGFPEALRPDTVSIMPDASILGAVRAVGFLLFLILVIEVGTQAERSHALALFLMFGILAHGLFGMVALRLLDDYSIWGEKEAYLGMLTGTFVNRNSIATFLGFGVVLALAFAMTRSHEAASAEQDRGHAMFLTPQRLEVLGFYLIAALLALAIVLTQSRMGMAATLAGAAVTYLVLRFTFHTAGRRIALETGGALLVLVAQVLPFAGAGLVERTLFSLVDGDFRFGIYQQVWGMVLDRPLAGFGYDAFAPAFELYRAEPLVVQFYIDLAHNTYLALWAEQGLLIGSIPMVLTLWAAATIVQRLRAGDGDIAVNAAAIGVITIGALHSLVDFSLEIPANVYCFLLIVGLAMARPREPVVLPKAAETGAAA